MATELIKVSELPVKTTDFGDGDLIIVSEYNGGTYVSKSKNAYKIGLDAAAFDPKALWNIGVTASASSNALTIALKQKDQVTDPTTGVGRCRVSFRSSTITSGAFTSVDITAALNTVISSGSTAGHMSGTNNFIYVYLLNNAGTAELAWCSTKIVDEKRLYSTTAEGGAGAADGPNTIYSTTARSNVPMRLIGCISVNQATAGTWATGPSAIYTGTDLSDEFTQYLPTFGGFGTVTNVSILSKKNSRERIIFGKFTAGTPSGDTATITIPSGITCGGLTSTRCLVGDIVRAAVSDTYRLYGVQGTNTLRIGTGAAGHGDIPGTSFTTAGETFYFRCVVPINEY